jgi:hypothetical protein
MSKAPAARLFDLGDRLVGEALGRSVVWLIAGAWPSVPWPTA